MEYSVVDCVTDYSSLTTINKGVISLVIVPFLGRQILCEPRQIKTQRHTLAMCGDSLIQLKFKVFFFFSSF